MNEKDTITIPREKLKLLTFEGYMKAFFDDHLPAENNSSVLAFRRLEADLYNTFGIHRYKSYGSFRRMKSFYLERKLKN